MSDEEKPDDLSEKDESGKKGKDESGKKDKDESGKKDIDESGKKDKGDDSSDKKKGKSTLLFILIVLIAVVQLVSCGVFGYLAFKAHEDIAALKKAVEELEQHNQILKELHELRKTVNELQKGGGGAPMPENSPKTPSSQDDAKTSPPEKETENTAKKTPPPATPDPDPPLASRPLAKASPHPEDRSEETELLLNRVKSLLAETDRLKMTVERLERENARLAAHRPQETRRQKQIPHKRAGPEFAKPAHTEIVFDGEEEASIPWNEDKKEVPDKSASSKADTPEKKHARIGIATTYSEASAHPKKKKNGNREKTTEYAVLVSEETTTETFHVAEKKGPTGISTLPQKTDVPKKAKKKESAAKLIFLNRGSRVLSGQVMVKLVALSRRTATFDVTLPSMKVHRFDMEPGERRQFECNGSSYFLDLAAIGPLWARIEVTKREARGG